MPSVKIKVFECRQAFSPGRNQHFNHH
jgi:hypothetical protein